MKRQFSILGVSVVFFACLSPSLRTAHGAMETALEEKGAELTSEITQDLITFLSHSRGNFIRQERSKYHPDKNTFALVFKPRGAFTRKEVVEVQITNVKVSGSSAIVWASYSGGPVDGATLKYNLKRQGGKWIITKREVIGVS